MRYKSAIGVVALWVSAAAGAACGTSSANGGFGGDGSGGASSGGGAGPGGAASSGSAPAGTSSGAGSASGASGSSGGSGGGASGRADAGRDGAAAGSSSGGGSSGASGGGAGSSASSSSGAGSSGASSGGASSGGVAGDGGTASCSGDPNLPPEPTIPPACTTLTASQAVASGGVPSETTLDTSRIQSALGACPSGQAVRLAAGGGNNAFITGPLTIPSGVTLWVDAGTTLYGTRSPSVYGSAAGLITVRGANQGIVGDGVIDGQGGEPMIGGTGSFWDQNGNGGSSPALIAVSGATNFTLYRITLHNSPMFHVKLAAAGFVVWGVTIKTPSKSTNSAGTALTPTSAHNTDGIDPGEAASNGFIVCSNISDGDDHIAIKGGTGVDHITIAHNHFLAGHGMSIGSETNGGVSNVNVYDLSIDGTTSGFGGGSSNGIRIKSDPSRGGLVTGITYTDVCVRNLANPILLTPRYTSATGTLIPQYTGITIRDFHALAGSLTPTVTLDGFDSAHVTTATLDNVIVDGTVNVSATNAAVTLGPGNVNFTPSGTNVTVSGGVSGTSTPNPCTGKWVTF
ncbi:MAG TPA: glycosyl hydrolase family 28 protein [Polyangiaceae bacterium]|nr:glycosyl hydrolase family 28 protein [Polyangiaceae bacterium]